MATPSVELPWHQRGSTCSYTSPKLSLRNTGCFGNCVPTSQSHVLPLNSLLSTSTNPSTAIPPSSPMSKCGTPLSPPSDRKYFQHSATQTCKQTSSIFRIGAFNPLWSRSLIQMHLNRILYYQPSNFSNYSYYWNVPLKVCVQTPPDSNTADSCTPDSDFVPQENSKAQDEPPTLQAEPVAQPQVMAESQTQLDGQEMCDEIAFPTTSQIPPESQEDQTSKVKAEHSQTLITSLVNPQEPSQSLSSETVAWQPVDQRNDGSDNKGSNDDIIDDTNDSGSEMHCEYSILVQCPDDEDRDTDEEFELECELYESDFEEDNSDDEDDDFIQFSDESYQASETANSIPESESSNHQQANCLVTPSKAYMSLLSAESGYFEECGDLQHSYDEDDDDDDEDQEEGDEDEEEECESQSNVACEELWKIFEEQALSPIPARCSRSTSKKCATKLHQSNSASFQVSPISSVSSHPTNIELSDKVATHLQGDTKLTPRCTEAKSTKVKCVRFKPDSELVEVHHMVAWSYAYRAARKCVWEQYARDRMHFMRRVSNLAPILEPCLARKIENIGCSNSDCVLVR